MIHAMLRAPARSHGLLACAASLAAGHAAAQPPDIGVAPVVLDGGPYVFDTAEQHGIRVDVVVRGLAHPFSLAFLPNGDALIAERGGYIRRVRGATGEPAALDPEPVPGGPPPSGERIGGLHDIALHPEYERNRLVYLTYNEVEPGAASGRPGPVRMALVVMRARFDGERLVDLETLYAAGARDGGSGSRSAPTARCSSRPERRSTRPRSGSTAPTAKCCAFAPTAASPTTTRSSASAARGPRSSRSVIAISSGSSCTRAAPCSRPSTDRTAATRSI